MTQKDQLRTPADGYVSASDAQTIFFGKLNAVYGGGNADLTPDNYRAPVGFMAE